MLKPEEEVDVEVNKEDQERINMFGRLNLKYHELEAEMKLARDDLSNVQDASNEILLSDDEGPVKYRVGEVFVEVPKDEMQSILEKEEERLQKEIEDFAHKIESIKVTMQELKVKLYAKFGHSINLEED